MSLEVCIEKKAGEFQLDIDFTSHSPTLGILGASGCGKSMTLQCIAGTMTPDKGRIAVDGRVLYDSAAGINLPPQQRRVGYLFQDYALFPHMTAAQNIACGVRQRAPQRQQTVAEMMARFQLDGLGGHYPHQLSGGQRQRVALSRMLASAPDVILLDEPFSALDAYLREQLQHQLTQVLAGQKNAVMVTHSRDEVYRLCDELMTMDRGTAVRQGATKALFRQPGEVRAARLTGCKNISPIRRLGEYWVEAVDWGLQLRTALPVGPDIRYIGIRAHDFQPCADGGELRENQVSLQLVSRWEDPFEWNILFTNGDKGDSHQLWWKHPKPLAEALSPVLTIPPDSILLLSGEQL